MNEIEELIKRKIRIWQSRAYNINSYEHIKEISEKAYNDFKELEQLADKGITEQQALNKLAERFPMTTDQIVSTLEMSQAGINHEPVEVPEFVADWIKHVKGLCWGLADLLNPSASNAYRARGIKEWLEKDKTNAEILAHAWLDGYTVAKEPLYIMPVPHLSEVYYTQDDGGVLDVSYGIGSEFTMPEIKQLFPSLIETAVPVEEEAE